MPGLKQQQKENPAAANGASPHVGKDVPTIELDIEEAAELVRFIRDATGRFLHDVQFLSPVESIQRAKVLMLVAVSLDRARCVPGFVENLESFIVHDARQAQEANQAPQAKPRKPNPGGTAPSAKANTKAAATPVPSKAPTAPTGAAVKEQPVPGTSYADAAKGHNSVAKPTTATPQAMSTPVPESPTQATPASVNPADREATSATASSAAEEAATPPPAAGKAPPKPSPPAAGEIPFETVGGNPPRPKQGTPKNPIMADAFRVHTRDPRSGFSGRFPLISTNKHHRLLVRVETAQVRGRGGVVSVFDTSTGRAGKLFTRATLVQNNTKLFLYELCMEGVEGKSLFLALPRPLFPWIVPRQHTRDITRDLLSC